jgi:hypothetical protein
MRGLAIVIALALASTVEAAPAKPMIELLFPRVIIGGYDLELASATLHRSESVLLACYAKVFARKPTLEGVTIVRFEFGDAGTVTSVHAAGLENADVETCIEKVVARLTFARPEHGAVIDVAMLMMSDTPPPGPSSGGAVVLISGPDDRSDLDDDLTFPTSSPMPPAARPTTPATPTVPPPAPRVRLGSPAVVGELDRAIVRRIVKRNLGKLAACAAAPGRVVAELTITANTGIANISSVSGIDAKVDGCVRDVIMAMQFPKPRRDVAIVYPITFL